MTARFEDALDVRPLDDGENWRVMQAFHYDTDVMLAGVPMLLGPAIFEAQGESRIEIPVGFETDFASIPRPLWSIVGAPSEGKYRLPAVVHDFLYRTQGLATRPQADSVFLEAMKVAGVGWWARSVIYSGVRTFGGVNSYKGGL